MRRPGQSHARRLAAFTMVELALCIAVIAIAMVAIIGVLPAGLGVQKQNREETIVDQDATLLMEAIRNGAVGFDDITNYVDYIVVSREPFVSLLAPTLSAVTNIFQGPFFRSPAAPTYPVLAGPEQVLGLLSLPRLDYVQQGLNYFAQTNRYTVTAQFRAFNGALNDKVLPQSVGATPDAAKLDVAFRYLLTAQISPLAAFPTNRLAANSGADRLTVFQERVRANTLYDVRLTIQWPVFGDAVPARVGGNQKVYRTQVFGRLAGITNTLIAKGDLTLPQVTVIKPDTLRLRRFIPGSAAPPSPLSSYQPKAP